MYSFSKFEIVKKNYLNLLLAALPLSFIAGNMAININIVLIILSSLFIFGRNLFKINYFFLDKLIFLFFLIILLSSIINDYFFYMAELYWKGNFSTVTKSFAFLRYLLLYIILRFLVEKEIINLKIFFISCTFFSLFVCFDIFYQLFNGEDIFGFKTIGTGRKLGGPFDDELVAGGFIQRFSIFAFFVLPIFYLDKIRKYYKILIPIFFLIFFSGIILSGNRMPLILFLLSIILIFIFQKQVRKYLIFFITIFFLSFFIATNFSSNIKTNFLDFSDQIYRITNIIIKQDFDNKYIPLHLKEFSTFYETWRLNKYIGGGIKNFRYYCHKRANIKPDSKFICNMHPHNYYLEVLTETGIFGFITLIGIFFLTLYISFYKKYFSQSLLKDNMLIIPFIFLFIAEIFPLKSTGSFFTTGNTTYLIIIMGILIGLARKDNSIEKKN
jgi:O-antigen ligase